MWAAEFNDNVRDTRPPCSDHCPAAAIADEVKLVGGEVEVRCRYLGARENVGVVEVEPTEFDVEGYQ